MKKNISLVLTLAFITLQLQSQNIKDDNFTVSILNENFNTPNGIFETITTSENYFINDNGDYLMSRNSSDNEYAVIAKNSYAKDFILKTSLRIGPSNNKKASIGVILKAQDSGKGAIIFEINKKGEYRIKKLHNGRYKILSGNNLNDGWTKSQKINKVNKANIIEIRCKKNIYDVYVNQNYIKTFFVTDYVNGSFGLIINSSTKARVDYYYLNTSSPDEDTRTLNPLASPNIQSKIKKDLRNELEKVNQNNLKLIELNKNLQKLIDSYKNDELNNLKLNNEISLKEKEIENLKKNIEKLNTAIKATEESNINITLNNTELSKKILLIKSNNDNLLTQKNREILEKKEKITSLKSTIEYNSLKMDEVKSQLSKANQEINDKEQFIAQKNNYIDSLSNLIVEKKYALQSLESYNLESKKELDQIKIKFEESIKKYSTELHQLKKEINLLQSKKDNLENLNIESKNKIASLNKELKKALNLIDEKKQIINENKLQLENTITLNTKEKNKLSKNIKNLSNSIKINEENQNKLNKQLTTSRNQINELERQEKKSQSKIKNLSAELNNKISELANSKNENKIYKNRISKLDSLNKWMNIEIENQKKSIINLYEDIENLDKKNQKLKDLFIMRDFEVNGIKPSKMLKKKYIKQQSDKKEKIYSVQIGVYMTLQPYTNFKNLKDVWYEKTEKGTFIYFSGRFKSSEKATEHRINLVNIGYTNAFIVSLLKNNKNWK